MRHQINDNDDSNGMQARVAVINTEVDKSDLLSVKAKSLTAFFSLVLISFYIHSSMCSFVAVPSLHEHCSCTWFACCMQPECDVRTLIGLFEEYKRQMVNCVVVASSLFLIFLPTTGFDNIG